MQMSQERRKQKRKTKPVRLLHTSPFHRYNPARCAMFIRGAGRRTKGYHKNLFHWSIADRANTQGYKEGEEEAEGGADNLNEDINEPMSTSIPGNTAQVQHTSVPLFVANELPESNEQEGEELPETEPQSEETDVSGDVSEAEEALSGTKKVSTENVGIANVSQATANVFKEG
eukprot:GHVS01084823.1.p1 GENE.GHVS01084823.1~~GHVS01084823.1.p1  ORF type:complete len:173 (-),score=16.90 GHVS01084823.1:611-1129(-)